MWTDRVAQSRSHCTVYSTRSGCAASTVRIVPDRRAPAGVSWSWKNSSETRSWRVQSTVVGAERDVMLPRSQESGVRSQESGVRDEGVPGLRCQEYERFSSHLHPDTR